MRSLRECIAVLSSVWVADDGASGEEDRARRASLLDTAAPPITAEDRRRIMNDHPRETLAIRAVKRWLERHSQSRPPKPPPRMLVLLGPVGTGKTVAAAYALAREPGRYVTARDLSVRFNGDWRNAEWCHALRRTRLLVIDDLGAETADSREAVQELINDRQVAGALTIFTGNLSPAQFLERIGARAADRINQIGAIVECKGPSMRQRRGAS